MQIGTINIDWAGVYKSDALIPKIEALLTDKDFEVLILTEAIELQLFAYPYVYKTTALPVDREYEEMEYGKYLKGHTPYRTIIYSKYPSVRIFDVSDPYTSLAHQFESPKGTLNVYATIVGTWFNRKPYAGIELENCIRDCKAIYEETQSLILAGDLNTSFTAEDKLQISTATTEKFETLFGDCEMYGTTLHIRGSLNHILIPADFDDCFDITAFEFVRKGVLSDHVGVGVEIF